MSVLDDLKVRSLAQNAGAPTGSAPPAPPRSRSSAESYCAYWIAQLEALRSQPPEAVERAVREAIQQAPARRRPSVEDGRLFVLAARALSAQDLIDWLRVRSAFGAHGGGHEGVLPADVARYWLRRLDGASGPDTDWAERCRGVAQDAVRAGQGLDPRLVDALVAQPSATLGYLRAAGTKGQFREADARAANLTRADPETPARSDFPPAPETGSAIPGTPPLREPDNSAPPPPAFAPSANLPGGGVGLRLGGMAGAAIGGAVAGAKAAFSRALGAAPARGSEGTSPATSRGFWARRADERAARDAAEAQAALAAFSDAAARLDRHPKLAAFWEALDREAATRFQGQRAGVFREMCAQAHHPLRRWFERVRDREPEIALHFERSQAVFADLEAVWTACAGRSKAAPRWAPSAAQLDLLHTACRQVPPDRERPPLIERAEQLVKALSAAIRQTFDAIKRRKPAAGTAPAP